MSELREISAPGQPPQELVDQRDRRLILAMAMLGSLLGNMGFTGLNLALPGMERELGLSAALLGWVPLSMFMAMAAVAAPGAKLADILGRRRTSIFALIISIIGLGISALAWNAAGVILGRVVAGLGVAMVFTNSTAMVTSVYPARMRGRVLGYTIASVYLGLSLGPVICGYLVAWFGWRSVFWLSLIGFVPPLILILMVRVEQRPAQGQKLDLRGSLLWASAVLTLFLGLTNVTRLPLGPAMIMAGLALAWAYVRVSLASENPVLDVRLFRSRRFAFSSLAAFISYCAAMGTGFILSLYLQYTKGLPTATAGLVLMIQPACQAVITPFAGRLSDRVDAGIMASAGMGVLCLATGLLAAFLTPETPLPTFIALLILLGTGFAIFGAPNSNAIIGSAPPGQVGQASGTITATRLCGQVFSISLTTLIFSLVIGPGKITPEKYPAFMEAATVCLTIFAPICFAGIIASLARGKKTRKPPPTMTKILFLGDIFGRPGRQAVRNLLPGLVSRENIDLALANGENASGGLGLNPEEAAELLDMDLAVLTGGNHTFRYKSINRMLDDDPRLVRPANYPQPCPGRGWTLAETAAGVKVAVGNVMGRVFMNTALDCPFKACDVMIKEMKAAGALITIIDIHAEATSEKRALAWHLDGRAGALLGTHTHVATADAEIMPGGLAYQTDLGMCGPHQSIIGMSRESVLPTFLSGRPSRFEPAAKGAKLNGVIIDFDDAGRAADIRRVDLKVIK